MGIKARKYVRVRDQYDPDQFDQYGVDPDEIPAGAPTNCACCGDLLTPLRRLRTPITGPDGQPLLFCTADDCLLAGRQAKTANWRLANLSKQGDELVILEPGQVLVTSKRGAS